MLHIAKVYNEDESLKVSESFGLLTEAVFFCNNEATLGDKCEVVEGYSSLTGEEEHLTITTWTNEGTYYD